MLERLFGTTIHGSYDVKYLDPENDQITVTSDTELVDAFGIAPLVGEHKVLRLYLVPKGTNPALMASAAPSKNPVVAEVDLTSLLSNLASSSAGNSNNGANPLMNLLNNLLSASNANASAPASSSANHGCPWMASRPEERVHMYYVCDGCENSPIRGNLYQCDVCPDYHLCENCRNVGVHLDKNHSFTTNPPRRQVCTRNQRRPMGCSERKPDSPSSPVAPAPAAPVVPVPTSPATTKPAVPVVSPVLTKPKPAGIVEATNPSVPVVNPFIPQVHVVSERLEMSFLSDVTIPDGTEVFCGESFSKVWRLSNSGVTAWPLGCRLSLESTSGERLSSVETIEIPGEVPPGSAVTISVEMEAPKKAGRHASHWRMHGPSGTAFGNRIWVDIIAVEKPAPAVVSAPAPVSPPAPTAPTAPASEPAIKEGEQYATQLESLYRMGFLNIDLNRNLLEHAKGNLPSVIDQLVSHQH